MQKIQAIRGMNDLLPENTGHWQYFEKIILNLAKRYGYQEIRFPLLEKTELFTRSVGEVTDIVEKEMYTFTDRSGDSLTLRPEGTASCVRAAIEHGLLHNQSPKLWYRGPIFRYERPQKGRYRQFYQVGFEAFGEKTPEIDVEVILISHRLWQELGIANHVALEINSLGSNEERACYRKELITYFEKHQAVLDADSQRRLYTNPLRILDSKNPALQQLIEQAPKLLDYLQADSLNHFTKVCQLLELAGIKYKVNPRLVRGLDYYCQTVFEWVTTALGAQGTICAGGRYDGLVELLGGKATPAIGFAMGVERIIELLFEFKKLPPSESLADIYFVAIGEQAKAKSLVLAEQLRTTALHLKIIVNHNDSGFKSQLKRADQSGAKLAVIIGEDELNQGKATIKYLRVEKPQQQIEFNQLIQLINNDQ